MLTLAYGCAGSSGPPTSTERASSGRAARLDLAPGVTHVFIADSVGNVVTIYKKNEKIRQLTGFDESQLLATDAAGNLFVANSAADSVEVFAPPYRNKPTFTISAPDESPAGVAVAKDGTVALIGCHLQGSQCHGAVVNFFANARAQSPCATVRGTVELWAIFSGAFDAQGTLYVAGLNEIYTRAHLGAVSGECSATKMIRLQPTTKLHFAAGVAVDPSGNIATIDAGDPSRGAVLDVFSPPSPGSRTLKLLSQNALAATGVVSSFALTKDGTALYTAEPRDSLEYAYPGGGNPLGELNPPRADAIEGVAVTPAEVP